MSDKPHWPPLIASDGELVTPFFKGRVIVEDVQQDRFTTTVTFIARHRTTNRVWLTTKGKDE
jgi:hypothetical protein